MKRGEVSDTVVIASSLVEVTRDSTNELPVALVLAKELKVIGSSE